jgi:Holliday junction resolvasome RuvABC endonuclease subunit
MRILGLDLSLRSTGYCLLDDDWVVWHGVVGSDHAGVERLAMFDNWIRLTLGIAHLGRIAVSRFSDPINLDHVAIEGYSFASQFRGPELGELGGVIKLAIHQARIPMTIVPPSTWKKTLCGKGNVDKRQASVEISKRYAVEFAKEDTLDAWAVAMCLRRQLLGLDKPEPKSRKRAALSTGKLGA